MHRYRARIYERYSVRQEGKRAIWRAGVMSMVPDLRYKPAGKIIKSWEITAVSQVKALEKARKVAKRMGVQYSRLTVKRIKRRGWGA
jgi:nickel-dependent lactate racemase